MISEDCRRDIETFHQIYFLVITEQQTGNKLENYKAAVQLFEL